MSTSGSRSEVVLRLAEEFLDRYRQGRRPSLKEYIDRHPELADEIREVFPAMAMMEKIALADESMIGDSTGPAPMRRTPPPEQLGDFRILREIGRGGMGVVYEAEQVSLGRHVALKLLPPQKQRDASQRRRFEREARAAARLHHTNIVPVFGVGEHDETPYYVMQFIQGLGLDEVLDELKRLHAGAPASPVTAADRRVAHRDVSAADVARSLWTGRCEEAGDGDDPARDQAGAAGDITTMDTTPRTGADALSSPPSPGSNRPAVSPSLSSSSVLMVGKGQGGEGPSPRSRKPTYWQGVAQIGVQVADALDYAHNQGILHRDIKPSNLLLDTRGTVWITDFGLAKAEDQQDLTHTGDILGTLRYMPPEAFEGKSGARGDVYSLGMTLYELLAFRPAFGEKERGRLVRQVTTEEPERLGRLNPEIPRDLETIVHKAIAKEPARRYASAGELAADLRRFLNREPIKARSVGALERAWIWARRRPAFATLAVVSGVAALAIVGAGVAFIYNTRLEAKNAQLEFHRYFHHIARAHAGWREGNMVQVETLLDECPPARRSWEWHYLKRLCHTDLLTLEGHSDAVSAVAYSPDGTRLASASSDDTVRVWDAITGRVVRVLSDHTDNVNDVAFSPDGRTLASAGADRTVRLWDVATGQSRTLAGHTRGVTRVVFSPDGHRLASGDAPGSIKVWDVATGQEIPSRFPPSVHWHGLAYSPDGRWLAAAHYDSFVRVWDATTSVLGELIHSVLPTATSGAVDVAFSPDGRRLASCSLEGTITVWDVATWQILRTIPGHASPASSVVFSPDGRRLASSSVAGVIKVWELDAPSETEVLALHGLDFLELGRRTRAARSAQEPLTLKGHTGSVQRIAFSPDGLQLASAGADGKIKVWDARSDPEARTFEGRNVAFSPDGHRLATTSWHWAGAFKMWDTTTGQVIHTFTGQHAEDVLDVAFSPDGTRLASSGRDGTVRLWDVATGRWQRTLDGDANGVHYCVAFSPDGRSIASGGDGRVKLWDTQTWRLVHDLPGHELVVWSVAFGGPGGRWLASASLDRTVRLWDVTTGQPIASIGHAADQRKLAFSPDGARLATVTEDHSIRLRDIRTRQTVRSFTGNMARIMGVAFTPDGRRLASTGADGTVKLWDVETGQEALLLRGHKSTAMDLAFSPDGTRLVTGDNDCRGRLWDARPLTAEAAIEREAVGLLDSLFGKPLRKADVIGYLQDTPTIRPRVRRSALSLAEGYLEETDPEKYHRASWAIVCMPHLNAFQYRFALLQAEHACRLADDAGRYRTLLGAAQYRAGRYQEAVTTLTRAGRPDTIPPAVLAFQAMAQHRLGRGDEARATLGRLRELVNQPRWTGDAETRGLVREAEALVVVSAGATGER